MPSAQNLVSRTLFCAQRLRQCGGVTPTVTAGVTLSFGARRRRRPIVTTSPGRRQRAFVPCTRLHCGRALLQRRHIVHHSGAPVAWGRSDYCGCRLRRLAPRSPALSTLCRCGLQTRSNWLYLWSLPLALSSRQVAAMTPLCSRAAVMPCTSSRAMPSSSDYLRLAQMALHLVCFVSLDESSWRLPAKWEAMFGLVVPSEGFDCLWASGDGDEW